MDNTFRKLTSELQRAAGGHLCYCFSDLERYIEHAVSYIVSGVKQGDYIVFIENDRIFPLINKKVKALLTKPQIDKILHVNNFDFYYSNRDFHTYTIVSNFSKILQPYIDEKYSIRTWAHVEWGDENEISCKIGKYEKEADLSVQTMKIVSVCAYDTDRITDTLKASLARTHRYQITDDEILPLNE